MDAIEYVEMLTTLDRQIAGLEDLLTRPELPAMTVSITRKALERWRAIRVIVARQNQPTPLIAPQLAALRRIASVLQALDDDPGMLEHMRRLAQIGLAAMRQNFDEEVFAK